MEFEDSDYYYSISHSMLDGRHNIWHESNTLQIPMWRDNRIAVLLNDAKAMPK